jgi:hypothetical protein
VAVEGEFRRLVHYVDDLVDGRAIRDGGEAGRLARSAIAACITTSSAWLAVSPSGLCPGSTVLHGASCGVYVHCRAWMTARAGSYAPS